jgi:hypothetical protein
VDGTTTVDTTPVISGTGETDATAVVTEAGAVVCTTVVTGTTWTCDATTLADGPHTLVATQTDAGGNQSGPSAPVTFVLDTTLPAAPAITVPADGSVITDVNPAIAGTGETGATVTVLSGGTIVCTAAVVAGVWACAAAGLTLGAHVITAIQTDAAGNISPESPPVGFTISAVGGPPAPVITGPVSGSHVSNQAPVIVGTGRPGDTVTITDNGTVICSTVVSLTGTFTCAPTGPLAEGPHVLLPTATDTAGNATAGEPVAITVDTVAPSAPGGLSAVLDANGLVTISGTTEPGTTVVVTDGSGAEVCRTRVPADGTWSCSGPVASGPLSVVAVDDAGNVSPPAELGVADLQVSVDLPDTLSGPQDLTVVVTNNGPSAVDATLTLELPDGLTLAGPATGADCTGTTLVTCTIPTIQPFGLSGQFGRSRAGVALTTVVTVPIAPVSACRSTTTNATATARVTGDALDLAAGNNSDTAVTALLPDLTGCPGPLPITGRSLLTVQLGVVLLVLGSAIVVAARWHHRRRRVGPSYRC